MVDSEKLAAPVPATDAEGKLLLSADEARDLLRDCFAAFEDRLRSLMRMSVETTNEDRKSTRLNSSHQIISYAVFCLKKKKKTQTDQHPSTNNHTHQPYPA